MEMSRLQRQYNIWSKWYVNEKDPKRRALYFDNLICVAKRLYKEHQDNLSAKIKKAAKVFDRWGKEKDPVRRYEEMQEYITLNKYIREQRQK